MQVEVDKLAPGLLAMYDKTPGKPVYFLTEEQEVRLGFTGRARFCCPLFPYQIFQEDQEKILQKKIDELVAQVTEAVPDLSFVKVVVKEPFEVEDKLLLGCFGE